MLSEVQRVCDRVGIIRDGRLVTLSNLDELRGKSSLEEIFLSYFSNPKEKALEP